MPEDLYELLQVSPTAEPEVIEAAYRRLARKYHPDVDPSPNANERMKDINRAYQVLRDPVQRAQYDRGRLRGSAYGAGSQSPTGRAPAASPDHGGVQPHEQAPKRPPPVDPPLLSTLVLAVLLLLADYSISLLFRIPGIERNSMVIYGLVAAGILAAVAVAIVGTHGWSPQRPTILRFLLILGLAAFPVSAWIPCYWAGKAIGRTLLLRGNKSRPLVHPTPPRPTPRWPIVLYGAGSIVLSIAVFGEAFQPAPKDILAEDAAQYASQELGVSFSYPSSMKVQDFLQRERDSGGALIKIGTISADSQEPLVILLVQTIEDPLRNEMYPALYPPTDTTLQLLVVSSLSSLQFTRAQENMDGIDRAATNAVVTSVSGFPAATFSLPLKGTPYGDVYMRGALVITDSRDILALLFGADEQDTPGWVSREVIDRLWERFASTLKLSY